MRVYLLRLTSIFILVVRLVLFKDLIFRRQDDETTPLPEKGVYRPLSKPETDPGILTRYTIITFKLVLPAFTEA